MSIIEEATAAIAGGRTVVLPTDTVYGVAAALDERGVNALFRVKRRPRRKAIPVLGGDAEALAGVVKMDRRAALLAKRFWPGALTLVLPRAATFDLDLGGTDRDSVAVRVPQHEVTTQLLDKTGPLPITSANESGEPPAETVDAARSALGGTVSIYMDGGPGAGTPSTVVSLVRGLRILRAGGVTSDALRWALRA